MELRDYFDVLRRRWYIVLLVPIIVLVGALYQSSKAETTYTATAKLAITRTPEQPPSPNFYNYNDYYLYLASEYALDDFVEIVKGNVFARDVAQTVANTEHVEVSPGEVQRALSANRLNRILTINATSATSRRAQQIASAAAATLEQKGTSYFGFDSPNRTATIATIETVEGAAASTTRKQVLLALEVLVGLFAGILIAYFIEYIDDALRSPETVAAALDLPVIGTIPNGRRR